MTVSHDSYNLLISMYKTVVFNLIEPVSSQPWPASETYVERAFQVQTFIIIPIVNILLYNLINYNLYYLYLMYYYINVYN